MLLLRRKIFVAPQPVAGMMLLLLLRLALFFTFFLALLLALFLGLAIWTAACLTLTRKGRGTRQEEESGDC